MLLQELPARKTIPEGWPSTCLRCAAGQGVPRCHRVSLGCCSPVPEAQQTHCTFGSPGTGWDTLQDVSHCSSCPSPSQKCSSLWVLQEQRVQDAQKGLGGDPECSPSPREALWGFKCPHVIVPCRGLAASPGHPGRIPLLWDPPAELGSEQPARGGRGEWPTDRHMKPLLKSHFLRNQAKNNPLLLPSCAR